MAPGPAPDTARRERFRRLVLKHQSLSVAARTMGYTRARASELATLIGLRRVVFWVDTEKENHK